MILSLMLYSLKILLLALYSKAKGQYLRLAMPLHALFQVTPLPEHIPPVIPEDVQKASIALIGLCIEHTALLARREMKDGAITPPMNDPSQQPSTLGSSLR